MIHDYFGSVILLLDFSVFAFGLSVWQRMDTGFKMLQVLFGISFFSGVTAFATSKLGIPNLALLHVYTAFQLSLTLVALSQWEVSRVLVGLFHATIALYLVLWVVCKFTVERLTLFPTVSDPTAAALLSLFGIRILFIIWRTCQYQLTRSPRFWLVAGIVAGNVGSLLAFGASNVMMNAGIESFDRLWSLIWSANIVSSLCSLTALILLRTLNMDLSDSQTGGGIQIARERMERG